MRDAIAAAVDRGVPPAGADAETAIEMAIGAGYARHLAGRSFDEGRPERVADATLRALGAEPA